MPFPLRRVLDPVVEPIYLYEMKNYLRVDISDDDDLINSLISTARERAEDLTSRCLIAQQWQFSMDRFPTWWGNDGGSSFFFEHHHPRHHSMFRSDNVSIILPRGPVISVDSITYKDNSGALQTLDPVNYNVDLVSEPARIRPVYNGSWPVALFDTNSITITFTAGYQQTVTESIVVPAVAPYITVLARSSNALSLTSVANGVTPVAGCSLASGVITFPSTVAGQTLTVVYQTSSIPQSFIHAIKLIAGAYYENRSEIVQAGGNFNKFPMPLGAESLLGTYQLFPLGYPKS